MGVGSQNRFAMSAVSFADFMTAKYFLAFSISAGCDAGVRSDRKPDHAC